MINVKILLFGSLTDVTENTQIEKELEETTTVERLKVFLYEEYPLLGNHTFNTAVNQEVVNSEYTLQDGDEVALLPPFAGG